MSELYRNYVDGEWVESETGETFESRNPADRADVIGTFQQSGEADAERAVEAATAATETWADTPAPERGAVLRAASGNLEARKDELTETLQNHVKNTLAPYKYPRAVEFVDELPRTETGKIQRVKLREREREQYED